MYHLLMRMGFFSLGYSGLLPKYLPIFQREKLTFYFKSAFFFLFSSLRRTEEEILLKKHNRKFCCRTFSIFSIIANFSGLFCVCLFICFLNAL